MTIEELIERLKTFPKDTAIKAFDIYLVGPADTVIWLSQAENKE